MNTAHIFQLQTLLDCQPGAVVSKTLLKKDSGTVTTFAFGKGEGLSEHTAPFDAMLQVLEGGVTITISGKPYELTQGDSIIMPSHQPHALQADSDLKFLLTMIKS